MPGLPSSKYKFQNWAIRISATPASLEYPDKPTNTSFSGLFGDDQITLIMF
jgi:hypothetical protein